MSQGDDLKKLFRIKKNQVRMMADHGYDISEENPIFNYTLQQFIEVYSGFLPDSKTSIREILSTEYHKPDGRSAYVFYVPYSTGDIGKKQITKFISKLDIGEYQTYILITNRPLGSTARKGIQNKSRSVTHFVDKELSISPTDHVWVPKHTGLSMKESDEIIRRNGWNRANIPRLYPTDAIVKRMGFTRGQLVRIDCFNPLPGTLVDTYVYYRLVSDSTEAKANEDIINSYDPEELE